MISLLVELKDKHCVVVGGGKIAYRKVMMLLEEEAKVTVISPKACSEINELSKDEKIKLVQRKAVEEDFSHAFLTIAATNDMQENRHITQRLKSISLVNDASAYEEGNCQLPASFKKGRLHLSVSTNGASPKLAKRMKEEWQEKYDDNYIAYMDFLYEVRNLLKQKLLPPEVSHAILEEILDNAYKDSSELRYIYYEKLLNL
ncbi:precorrin-2 dehydrogenase/sirohydrochlorin ferrochelatase family protein [Niallia sp. Sow4_A1]|uniref:precorrin-2 dehydrogenase/sirohydrochlorin ferrochelatase family protein n=1 Tax=Niallia sp. Sow4_A1 TaxID=3438793 RepID=UPI003F98D398